jgi:hypothetical protein
MMYILLFVVLRSETEEPKNNEPRDINAEVAAVGEEGDGEEVTSCSALQLVRRLEESQTCNLTNHTFLSLHNMVNISLLL